MAYKAKSVLLPIFVTQIAKFLHLYIVDIAPAFMLYEQSFVAATNIKVFSLAYYRKKNLPLLI